MLPTQVLLLEPDPIQSHSLRLGLADAGFRVTRVPQIEELWRISNLARFELALLSVPHQETADLQTVANYLRDNFSLPSVLLITQPYPDCPPGNTGRLAEATLAKPYTSYQLRRLISEVLSAERADTGYV